MALISVKDLTFQYDSSSGKIFDHVSFNLDTRWRTALTGRNGRGKTTLLKILLGEEEYTGTVTSPEVFTYFPYEVEDPSLTVDELRRKIAPLSEEWEMDVEFDSLDLSPDMPGRIYETLSGGEKTKVLLALMFLRNDAFLLIDEPTNHLDMASRELLGNYLAKKKGFILVSHDRSFIDACCDHVMSINRSSIEIVKGNWSVYSENFERRENFERKQNEKLKVEIERLGETASRFSGWSDKLEATKYNTRIGGLRPDRGYIGAKSAKLMSQMKNTEKRISRSVEEKKALLKDSERADELKIVPEKNRSGVLVEFLHTDILYGEETVARDVTFSLKNGERIALCGPNGSGKSSILKLITGEDIAHTGYVKVSSSLKISYVPQDTSFLKGRPSELAEGRGVEKSVFFAMLSKLGFDENDMGKDVSSMSMGQRKKVALALSISENAGLYIWDEPLNYIDIISRGQLEDVILRDCPTMIFVEHEKMFCENAATGIVYL